MFRQRYFQLQMTGKYTSSKLNYLTNWKSTTNYIIHLSDLLFDLISVLKRIYTGVAGQRLK